jgi:hypothetical protein
MVAGHQYGTSTVFRHSASPHSPRISDEGDVPKLTGLKHVETSEPSRMRPDVSPSFRGLQHLQISCRTQASSSRGLPARLRLLFTRSEFYRGKFIARGAASLGTVHVRLRLFRVTQAGWKEVRYHCGMW